jgi:hypothetical protein
MDKGRPITDGDWDGYATGDGSPATQVQPAQAASPVRPQASLTGARAAAALIPTG